MKLRFTNDWKTYYPCHCKHCLWTGPSQDVVPQESYEYDGYGDGSGDGDGYD